MHFSQKKGGHNTPPSLPIHMSLAITLVLAAILLLTRWLPDLFSSDGFAPHGDCYLWLPGLVTLHVGSDAMIGLAYVFISATLLYFVLKTRRDIPFQWIFVAFGIFIIACGTTHFLEIWTLWHATYWLSGAVKLITAIASVATAVALPPMIPRVRALVEIAKVSEERKQKLEQAHKELEVLYAKVEDALHQSEQRFGHLTEAMPLLVWTSRADGSVDYLNQRWFDRIGIAQEQTGTGDWHIIHPDDRQRCSETWQRVVKQGEPYETEYRIQQASGGYHWYLARAVPTKDSQGRVMSWVGTCTDIEEQKRIQAELLESEQRKDAFLAMASHELKTPITSLQVYAQILHTMFLREGRTQVVQYLSKMEAQISRLTKLIADLLDISKIQAGKLALVEEKFEANTFVHELIETMQQTSTKHTISFIHSTPVTLTGDKDRLGQVLINLLTNAIKYSPAASNIGVMVLTEQDSVVFSVRDYGIGIPKEHQVKIFDRFYRVYDDKDKKFPGLGIGLYIASEIVQRHGGEIWLESEEGAGSTFSFSIPIRRSSKKEVITSGRKGDRV